MLFLHKAIYNIMEVFYKKKKKHNGILLTKLLKVLKNFLIMKLYFRFKQFQ